MDTQCGYGVDVAVTRADDLDKRMIREIQKRVVEGYVPAVLDLGCGGGGQSVRLATAGASVLAVDVQDHTQAFATARDAHEFSEGVLEFMQGDLSEPSLILDTKKFDVCCFQRAIHYLPYEIALKVLRDLHVRMYTGGKLYLSVTGLESDIGLQYDDAHTHIVDRFCRLNEADALTFNIVQPICLYTPEEFIVLLQESGWQIEECWVSAFGNIKAVIF